VHGWPKLQWLWPTRRQSLWPGRHAVNPSLEARARHPWLATVAPPRGTAAGSASARASFALLLVAATLALAGCGFHLQGASPLPEGNRKVRIVTADEVTPFAVELRRAIERSGGTVVATTAEADTVLRILRDRSGRRVLSVSASNTPQEYEIFYFVEFSVERAGKEVLEMQPLEMLRNMSFDDAQLLAKDREEAILREAMARDLALLVVRRLESL
jgi:LPS-assembly lipoprotein